MPFPNYETMKHIPSFKAFCRRRISTKPHGLAETLKASEKKTRAAIATFCRRKGINSILKDNEYTTGRVVKLLDCHVSQYSFNNRGHPANNYGGLVAYIYERIETARLVKRDGQIETEIVRHGGAVLIPEIGVSKVNADSADQESEAA